MAKLKKGTKAYFDKEIEIFNKTLRDCLNNENNSASKKAACEDAYEKNLDFAFNNFKEGKRYPGVTRESVSIIERALETSQTEQNFILQNIDKFVDFVGRPSASDLGRIVMVGGGDRGNLLNTLTASRQLRPLFNATSLQLSMLVPYIKLYKVTRNKEGEEVEQEFKFQGHLNREDLLKDRNSFGAGVGFKSFAWNTTGTNPFTAPRTLMATLTLYFQTIVDMNRATDGTFPTEDNCPTSPMWYDLFIQQGTKKGSAAPICNSSEGEADVEAKQGSVTNSNLENIASKRNKCEGPIEDFKIKVDVGWNYSDTASDILGEELKTAIDRSRNTFILGYFNHDIDFREDGSVEVKVSYVARMDGEMSGYDANLFDLDENGIDCGLYKRMRGLEDEIKKQQFDLSDPSGALPCEEQRIKDANPFKEGASLDALLKPVDEKAKALKKKINDLQEQLEGEKKRLKTSIYGKFLQYLIEKEKLYSVAGNEEDFRTGDFKSFKNPVTDLGANFQFAKDAGLVSNVQKTAIEAAREATEGAKNEEKVVNSTKFSQGISNFVENLTPLKEGKRRINFFYFGDLINFYAGALPEDSGPEGTKKKKYEIILGNLVFLDQKKKEELAQSVTEILYAGGFEGTPKEVEEKAAELITGFTSEGQMDFKTFIKSESLAHVPISLDLYTRWFTDAVINGDTVFTFKRFLELITSKLLVGALEPHNSSEISDLSRNLREVNRTRVAIATGANKNLMPGKEGLKIGVLEGEEDSLFISNYNAESAADVKEFLVLSATRLPGNSRQVNETKNAEEGIYHLRIGADKGIVKSINFNRETSAAMQTSNIMKAYNKGGGGLGILRLPYQATVKIVGNSAFQPGQYIYIDPTSVGPLDKSERLRIARDLIGLGGFYLITKTSSTLQSGMFETTIECKWETYGHFENESTYKKPGEVIDAISSAVTSASEPEPSIEEQGA